MQFITIYLNFRFIVRMGMTKDKATHLKKVLTLVYLLDGENILLGMKKRGFGVGKVSWMNNCSLGTVLYTLYCCSQIQLQCILYIFQWNGFGGKVHLKEGETIVEGAIREVKEECGLTVTNENLKYMGVIDFEFLGNPEHLEVHVFEAKTFSGRFKL